jgi:hypothetical protein
MLSLFKGFFSQPIIVPPIAIATNTQLLSKLSLQEITTLFANLKDLEAKSTFYHLNEEQQNHIFPLLEEKVRNHLFEECSDERQVELLSQCSGFRAQAMEDITHCDSFFYWMKVYNALKFEGDSKKSYVLTADKVLQFDFKPFKYQRQLLERHVQTIAEGITKSKILFHPLILGFRQSESSSSLTIIDGQHRYNALKRIETEVLATIYLQVDVILLPDNDQQIMSFYKHINTNVPLDPLRLQEELRYVSLIDKISTAFPDCLQHYSKDDKDKIPQHMVIDSWLKQELQYREILTKLSEDQVITKLKLINDHLSLDDKRKGELSMIELRMCKRNYFYLGLSWPLAVDLLEQ